MPSWIHWAWLSLEAGMAISELEDLRWEVSQFTTSIRRSFTHIAARWNLILLRLPRLGLRQRRKLRGKLHLID